MISSGNRTEWGAIRSCLITNMITDRVERHEVLLPINHNFNRICDIVGSFLNQNTASSEKKKHLNARVMARTVLLNVIIKAEIRAVDSQ